MNSSEAKGAIEGALERVFRAGGGGIEKVVVTWGRPACAQKDLDRLEVGLPDLDHNKKYTVSELNHWIGFALHEVGHGLFTNFDATGKGFVFKLLNGMEDPAIEQALINSGIAPASKSIFEQLVNHMIGGEMPTTAKNIPFTLAVEGRRLNGYKIDAAPAQTPWAGIVDKYVRLAQKTAATSEREKLAEKLAKELEPWITEKEEEKQQPDEGQQAGQGEEEIPVEPGADLNGASIATHPTSCREVELGRKEECNVTAAKMGMNAQALKAALWCDDRIGIKNGYRVGRLDKRRLARSATSDYVFGRRVEEPGEGAAVRILVDGSGSMGGKRMAKTASMVLGMWPAIVSSRASAKVWVFRQDVSTMGEAAVLYKICDSSQPSKRAIANIRKMPQTPGGGTPTDAAVSGALDELARAPERRKVLFVMADADMSVRPKELQEKADSLGIIMAGIGIAVDAFYQWRLNANAETLDELSGKSMKMMLEAVRKA